MRSLGLYLCYAILSSVAVILLKRTASDVVWPIEWSAAATRGYFALCFAAFLYICSFGAWMFILATSPLNIAYPVCVALTLVGTTVGSALLLREPIDVVQVVGIVVVLIGIVMVMRPWAAVANG